MARRSPGRVRSWCTTTHPERSISSGVGIRNPNARWSQQPSEDDHSKRHCTESDERMPTGRGGLVLQFSFGVDVAVCLIVIQIAELGFAFDVELVLVVLRLSVVVDCRALGVLREEARREHPGRRRLAPSHLALLMLTAGS